MTTENATVNYPTAPDENGFFIENEDDAGMGILSKTHPNGNRVKKALLPHCKKTAIVRELVAKETKEIARFMDKDNEKYQMALVTVATTFDGNKVAIEDMENVKLKDFNLILAMNADLNF